jgi:GNAT superfamily N-acetyltransferase
VIRTQQGASSGPDARLIRPVCAGDLGALQAFFTGLSVQTRYLRFFAPVRPTPALLALLSGGGNAYAVVATRHGGTIIGHAIAADRAGPSGPMTEIGVVVADAWQGQGVGSALLRALIAAARARGVTTVAMDVMADNWKALAMIAAHWPEARIGRSGTSVRICAGLPGTWEEPRPAQLARQGRRRRPGESSRSRRSSTTVAAGFLKAERPR